MTVENEKLNNEEGLWVIGYGLLIFKPPPHYTIKVNGYLKGFIRRFWQSSIDHRGTPETPGRVVTLVSLQDLRQHARFHNDLYMYELKSRDRETDLIDLKIDLSTSTESIKEAVYHINELKEDDLKVWGCAYYIPPLHVQEVKEYLDVREQNGYSTHNVPFHITMVSENIGNDSEILARLPKNDSGDSFIKSVIYIGTIENEAFIGPENIKDTAQIIKYTEGPSGKNIEYLAKLLESVKQLDKKTYARDYYLEDLMSIINEI